jgi:hypothetical protein
MVQQPTLPFGCLFKQSIVNAPRVTDHLSKSNLTFCVVCVFNLQTDEWCVHNRLFNANLEEKLKKKHPSSPYKEVFTCYPIFIVQDLLKYKF